MEENFDYVYHAVKDDVQLSSISGGTDIISCFAGGIPVSPAEAPCCRYIEENCNAAGWLWM